MDLFRRQPEIGVRFADSHIGVSSDEKMVQHFETKQNVVGGVENYPVRAQTAGGAKPKSGVVLQLPIPAYNRHRSPPSPLLSCFPFLSLIGELQ